MIEAVGALPSVGDVVDIDLPAPVEGIEPDEDAPRVLRAEVLAVDHYVPSRLRLTLPTLPNTLPSADDEAGR